MVELKIWIVFDHLGNKQYDTRFLPEIIDIQYDSKWKLPFGAIAATYNL